MLSDNDDEPTQEVPAPTGIEVARWWAQRWAVEAALNPTTELPDDLSGKDEP